MLEKELSSPALRCSILKGSPAMKAPYGNSRTNREDELAAPTSSEDEVSSLSSSRLHEISKMKIPDTPEKEEKLVGETVSKLLFASGLRLSESPNSPYTTSPQRNFINLSLEHPKNTLTTLDICKAQSGDIVSTKLFENDLFVESSDEENLMPLRTKLSTWRNQQAREFERNDEETTTSPKPSSKKNLASRNNAIPTKNVPSVGRYREDVDSDLEDIFVSLTVTEDTNLKPKKNPKPRRKKKSTTDSFNDIKDSNERQSTFLSSLSVNYTQEHRHPEAIPFLRTFKKTKDELTSRLFYLFNEVVFDNLLQRDFSITWNNRLTRTAGYCRHFTRREDGVTFFESRIELSSKVVDTACRLRDTLIHELCHAATWTIDNCRGGHGPMWRKWANRALKAFPELPPITRCHNYEIAYKFYYNCVVCSFSTGRHSKSVDTATHVCPMCRGRLELSKEPKSSPSSTAATASTPAASKTPRTPNAFALFVKEHYAVVKASSSEMNHAAVMKVLSAKFAESKKQSV
uniref:EOG090X0464 n=1 Tax=Moina brachiata TaxID=675436 RepID=A0A4Y7NIA1_9CRUS|nr:EOG090X0464 [Moina brachiata]SVE92939.1 EOG090X0464 [Moina brachiata]